MCDNGEMTPLCLSHITSEVLTAWLCCSGRMIDWGYFSHFGRIPSADEKNKEIGLMPGSVYKFVCLRRQ